MKACLLIEEDRTQRQSVVLRDVRYRITAQIVPRPDFPGSAIQLYNQFERRVKRGPMFVQPVMGAREFPAYFTWGSTGETPIQESLDLGLMVYDVFDLNIWKVEMCIRDRVDGAPDVGSHGVPDAFFIPLLKESHEQLVVLEGGLRQQRFHIQGSPGFVEGIVDNGQDVYKRQEYRL